MTAMALRPAIRANCPNVIVVHNHPSVAQLSRL